ncbi:MAG: argininosuccinate lyase [Deltaproteobacteria bacterium]|jgi:argininosuccinate lyase|nr:argininosuccinate lyase [Deltaproteobacteria bacterium]
MDSGRKEDTPAGQAGAGRPEGLVRSRMTQALDPALARAGVSVHFDRKLARHDLAGSRAQARMLGEAGLVSAEDSRRMIAGLDELAEEVRTGRFVWKDELEDVHMNLEAALTERLGPAGERLHTARSRNDQVALDERLYLREEIQTIGLLLWDLKAALVQRAGETAGWPMAGYTHLQRAQPIVLGHHLLAYFQMLHRDTGRLLDLRERLGEMPLGSGALAGTGLPVKEELTASELGFPHLSANSIDAVSSRDLLAEFLAFGAILMVHLSRLAEDIILWCTAEFGAASLPDSLATSSSMMPQKKNPDGPELIRGKTGRAVGNLVALLTVVKGLPLAYNRDLQEDKEPLFDTAETLETVLPLARKLILGLEFHRERMRELADDPYTAATDLADHLVLRGVPFREAHRQVGALVAHCVSAGLALKQAGREILNRFCPEADPEILSRLEPEDLLAARDRTPGGTAPRLAAWQAEKAGEALVREKLLWEKGSGK